MGAPERALVASSILHSFAYSGYVWLAARSGPVFAAQVSYIVTLFGVGRAMLILGESCSAWLWLAMAVMPAGGAMLQPRPRTVLAPPIGTGQNAA